jgi:hypothetical protein
LGRKGKSCWIHNKLENYDAGEIAKIATDHDLYEEALTIYKKYDQHGMAINVLVEIRQVSEVVKASFLGITKVRARWPGLLGCPSSVRSTAFALFEMAFSSTLYPLIVV